MKWYLIVIDFDLYFLNDKWHLSFFHVIAGHLYNFFGKVSIQVLCPFFCWIFFCFSCWVVRNFKYIFWIVDLFIHIIWKCLVPFCCLLILLTMSFDVQKLLILIKSNLSIFSFVTFDFQPYFKKHCQSQDHKSLTLCIYFIVLPLIFKSLIHFMFIFVHSIRVQLHSFTCWFPVVPVRLLNY